MKKLVLTSVCALAMTGAAFAQGDLTWNNFAGTFTAGANSAVSPLFGGTGSGGVQAPIGPGATAVGYYFELLDTTYSGTQAAVPSTVASLVGWSDPGLTATNGPGANGRIVAVNPNLQATVPWAQGTTQSVILVGWSANLGTSWLAVSNDLVNWATVQSTIVGPAYFGESATGYLSPNTSPANGATVFASAITQTANGLPITSLNTPLYLLPVPEPASLAIAGLGGLSLLLFRRQRK